MSDHGAQLDFKFTWACVVLGGVPIRGQNQLSHGNFWPLVTPEKVEDTENILVVEKAQRMGRGGYGMGCHLSEKKGEGPKSGLVVKGNSQIDRRMACLK
jgi:hypothetical protein